MQVTRRQQGQQQLPPQQAQSYVVPFDRAAAEAYNPGHYQAWQDMLAHQERFRQQLLQDQQAAGQASQEATQGPSQASQMSAQPTQPQMAPPTQPPPLSQMVPPTQPPPRMHPPPPPMQPIFPPLPPGYPPYMAPGPLVGGETQLGAAWQAVPPPPMAPGPGGALAGLWQPRPCAGGSPGSPAPRPLPGSSPGPATPTAPSHDEGRGRTATPPPAGGGGTSSGSVSGSDGTANHTYAPTGGATEAAM